MPNDLDVLKQLEINENRSFKKIQETKNKWEEKLKEQENFYQQKIKDLELEYREKLQKSLKETSGRLDFLKEKLAKTYEQKTSLILKKFEDRKYKIIKLMADIIDSELNNI